MSDSEPNRVEQAILGALLVDNRRYPVIEQIITPDHFASGPHRKLYEMITQWIENGRLADPVTLWPDITSTGLLDEYGGPKYIAELLKALPADTPS
ncbi:DnaB-like helicase N-terminal domain-containing protein [Gluconobacter sp. P1C6_b]|jgi:replicative DNA helicase|uniref:DnaB-like helicase N-terminal domain-containing protein n=1 Tax=Gluconobacter sp. P1C6_b TaxID=2762619 RepID=UPI001C05A538|nr:DnaB-like helicase N-terminal domain-containing protein [Gluconobacter sp. P1C6_b]